MKVNNINIKKILKVFTQPLNLERVTNNVDAWYFVPTNDPNTPYHIVVGPYFLRAVSIRPNNRPKLNSGVTYPKDCFLLDGILCWDGKGFGAWIKENPKRGLRWLDLNFNSEGKLNMYETSEAIILNADLDYYKELLKPFKTALMLMTIDITPNPERVKI